MPRVKPARHGVSFIVHTSGDQKDTWSQAFLTCISAEDCYRALLESSPGLQGRLEITKYRNGKAEASYDLETNRVD
jgi:hypothetical protein